MGRDNVNCLRLGWSPSHFKVVDFWAEKNGCNVDEKINFPDLDRSDKSTVSLVKRKVVQKIIRFGFIQLMVEVMIGQVHGEIGM